MYPSELATVPPLEITKRLSLPRLPTKSSFALVQSELLPATSTLLLEELASKPMYPSELTTAPPLEITMELPAPLEPT